MADKESTVLLRYTTDQASLRQTEAASKKLFTSLTTPKTVQSLKATNREVDNLKKSLNQTEQQAKETAQAVQGIVTPDNLKELRDIRTEGRFQSFALSSLGGVLPGGGGAGLQQFEGAFNLLDTIPKLDLTFDVLKESIIGNIQAIGATGVGLVGGLLFLAAATKLLNDEHNRGVAQVKAAHDQMRDYYALIASGTTESLQSQLEAAKAARDEAALVFDAFETQNQMFIDGVRDASVNIAGLDVQVGTIGLEFVRLTDTIGIGSGHAKQLSEDATEAWEELQRLEGELENIERALGSSRVAANDTAAAEKKLAEERIALAERTRQSVLQEQQFMGMSTDALNQRVTQLQSEIAANQAAAAVLREGGQDASQYEQAIADLNRQIEFIKTTATPAARAVEALAKAEERRTKAAEEAKRIQEDIKNLDTQAREQSQKVAEDYAKRQVDLAKKQAQGELDAQKDLQRRLTDAQTDLARDQANAVLEAQRDTFQAQLDFQRGEAEAARKHADSLEDIRLQAQRDERRNILDRNFKAIFEQRIQTRERIQDEQHGFSRERREAITAFKEQADDRNRAFADERADRLRQYEQARSDIQLDNQRRLSDLRANLMQERLELQAAYVTQLADLKAFLSAETAAKKLALQQQFSLTKGGSKTTPLSKGNSQPLPKVSNVNQQSNQQNVNVTINESGNPQKTLKAVKQAITA